jgi:HSP20 family protein
MALIRFRPLGTAVDPFHGVSDIQSEVNRLFDGFFGRQTRGPVERLWTPSVDMYETEDELVVAAEIPGLTEKDIHLSIAGDMLMLRGERAGKQETKQDNYYRGERWFGKFERSLPLPIPVQPDKVTASYRDGVLTIKLPKAEDMKSRDIKVDMA